VPYLKSKNAPHIQISCEPFSPILSKVGRVIMDYPVTSLYFAAAAKIPTLSLYDHLLPIHKCSLKYLEPMLKSYASTKEALAHVKTFLDGDGSDYVVDRFVLREDPMKILMNKSSKSEVRV
jgi:hypothetical protein